MKYTTFGYGDIQTWPSCRGHPNDPRTDEESPEEESEYFEYNSISSQEISDYTGWLAFENLKDLQDEN